MNFAPNPGTATRGKKLATPSKWLATHRTARALWGLAKGSGKNPYKVVIDLHGPAYKCSCPSREFPCKHALGLFIFATQSPDNLKEDAVPSWGQEWLDKRGAKATKVEPETKEKSEDELIKEAANKKKQEEKKKTDRLAGLNDLEPWLFDLLREGLASSEGRPQDFWDTMAARAEDAQLKGFRDPIKTIPELIQNHPKWPEELCYRLGDIYLMANALRKSEQLPPDLWDEVNTRAGNKISKKNLRLEDGIKDEWTVLGQISGDEEGLQFRRVWLRGSRTKRYALILDFVFGYAGFEEYFKVGGQFEGEMVYYPGKNQLRALKKSSGAVGVGFQAIEGSNTIHSFLEEYADAMAQNPWTNRVPAYFNQVIPIWEEDALWFQDQEDNLLPAIPADVSSWKLLAISGGHPMDVFGEWEDNQFRPLAAIFNQRIIELS